MAAAVVGRVCSASFLSGVPGRVAVSLAVVSSGIQLVTAAEPSSHNPTACSTTNASATREALFACMGPTMTNKLERYTH
jgi:hypothetical protein